MWAGIALAFWGFSVVEENDDEKVFGCYLRSAGSGFSTQCYAWYHSDTCSHVSLRWFREYFTHFLHEGCLCSVFPRNAGSTVDSCSCAIGALVSSSHCSVLCSAAEYKRFGIVCFRIHRNAWFVVDTRLASVSEAFPTFFPRFPRGDRSRFLKSTLSCSPAARKSVDSKCFSCGLAHSSRAVPGLTGDTCSAFVGALEFQFLREGGLGS